MRSVRVYCGILVVISVIPGCAGKTVKKKLSLNSKYVLEKFSPPQKYPPITIWVHGTRFVRRPLFHGVFNGQPGLRKAEDIPSNYQLHHLSYKLNENAPHSFPLETFYIFGWSGKLNSDVRDEAAEVLYTQLHEICQEYKKTYGHDPEIRIVAHSHGGNVALSMAKYKNKENPIRINQLILLACPVQTKTKKYIEDDLFDKTYAMYSSLDMVQVLAPQVVYNVYKTKRGHVRSTLCWPPISSRRFEDHPKLMQVKLKINGRALFHTEFASKRFASILPHVLYVINSWTTEQLQPANSNHLLCVYTKNDYTDVIDESSLLA